MGEVKTYLDVDSLRSRATSIPYPHINIVDLNKCVPVVVSALEEGDIPLLGTFKGTTKIVKSISNSALNIYKLIRVTEIEVVFNEEDVCPVSSVLDYMEVAQRWT